MPFQRRPWFRFALQLRGSVVPAVLPRTLVCVAFGTLITLMHYAGLPVSMPALGNVIPSIVLGLMLVFRTNTAYERFWEGRRLWGTIIVAVRNLARQIWVTISEKDEQDHTDKIAALHLLVAFAIATKQHLRGESPDTELKSLMSNTRFARLQTMQHRPLEVAFWIGDYLQTQYEYQRLQVYQLTAMQQILNQMVEALSGCERILKTPIPLAYAIHLKQLLLLYTLTLPFSLVAELGGWTGPIVGLISFTLFGIEEIGIEIENPFGQDANDLPLDEICKTMLRNIEELVKLPPNIRTWKSLPDTAAIEVISDPDSDREKWESAASRFPSFPPIDSEPEA